MLVIRSALHRHYNAMVDIAFWAFFLQSIIPWLRLMGLESYQSKGSLDLAFRAAFLLTWLSVLLLVVVRFARDEYAEGLWQKVGWPVIILLVAGPWVFCVSFLLFVSLYPDAFTSWSSEHLPAYVVRGAKHAAENNDPILETVGTYHYFGMFELLFWIGAYLPFVMLGMYKWFRWRDR